MGKNKKNCKKCIYFARTICNDKPSCIFNLENDICVPEYKEKEQSNGKK